MSTLDCAGNSNGEVPTHLWKIAKENPPRLNETSAQYAIRLENIQRRKS